MNEGELEIVEKERTKPYSVSLVPSEIEPLRKLGYTIPEVTRIGIRAITLQRSFIFSHLPAISTEIGIGLILLSFSVLIVDSVIYLSYILFFSSILFISLAIVSLLKLASFSRSIKRGRKNG